MLTGAFAAPLAMAVKGFAAFDDQMRLAKAVTKATRAEFESMTQVAAKLGRALELARLGGNLNVGGSGTDITGY